MKTKYIKCIVTKQRMDGLLDDFELNNSKDVVDIIPMLSEFNYFMLINQDVDSDLSDNPITIFNNNISLHSNIEELFIVDSEYFKHGFSTQIIRIYCFLNYSAMINFLDLAYH